jgi:predicted metalloprotease with PDZ domain
LNTIHGWRTFVTSYGGEQREVDGTQGKYQAGFLPANGNWSKKPLAFFFSGRFFMKRVLSVLTLLCLMHWTAGTASPQAQSESKAAPILLEVDAGEAPRKLYHARVVIPVQPGPITLYYPKWIPGTHGPSGPIADLAGLKMQAGGTAVPWKRDDVDMYAFHCTVPDGARALEVSLDLLAAAGKGGFGTATNNICVIRWNEVLLYPKGRPIQAYDFQATLKLPAGWKLSTALPIETQEGALTRFGPVSLETLVDSPVQAGAYHREIRLGPPGEPNHYLDLVCESPAGLEITPKIKANYEQLIAEAGALFGTRHYKSYRFLVTLSDKMPWHGLEHHESSDNGMPERSMSDEEAGKGIAYLLPHEYVHSWNGKYRRPAGLITPTYPGSQQHALALGVRGIDGIPGHGVGCP